MQEFAPLLPQSVHSLGGDSHYLELVINWTDNLGVTLALDRAANQPQVDLMLSCGELGLALIQGGWVGRLMWDSLCCRFHGACPCLPKHMMNPSRLFHSLILSLVVFDILTRNAEFSRWISLTLLEVD